MNKKNSKRALLMTSMFMALGMEDPLSDMVEEEVEKEKQKRPKKKPLPKGVKEYNINGHIIHAINEKNAMKKYKKKFE